MQLQDGKLAIQFSDIFKFLFFPFYLFWKGNSYLVKKHADALSRDREKWEIFAFIYWVVPIACLIIFTAQSLTFNREVVSVEYRKKADPVVSKESEAVSAVIMTMEERPKVFNTDQVKTWKFCRGFGTNGKWFEVDSDGNLSPVGDRSIFSTWEMNKNRYLEDRFEDWKKKEANDQALQELKTIVVE